MSNDTPTGPPEKDSDETPDRISDDTPSVPASDDTPTERFGADDSYEVDPHAFDADEVDPDELDADELDAEAAVDADAATKLLPATGQPVVGAHVPIAPATPPTPLAVPLAATPVAPATPPGGTVPPKKNRTLLYWLIGIGAVLLIAVIVLLVLLFTPGDDEPEPSASATPTPSATPSEQPSPSAEPSQEPSPTPTQAPAGPTFATFSAPTNANCQEGDDEAPLSFSWSSDDAVRAYLGVGTQNAAINPTVSDLPPTATYTDLPYDCSVASQVYTVTLEDEAGALASRTVTITQ